ncbi:sensor histidine kinase [Tenacibaculum pelagium]|nr:histidine kinase [Tenacibaculum pelagium]
MPITITLSYFIILHLIPKYLLKKQYFLFILYSIYTFLISFAVIIISIFYGLVFSSYLRDINSIALTKSLSLIILGVYFIVIIATSIALLIYNYLSSSKNEDLKNKFLQAQLQLKEQELKFLKMQLHPHFLFNTLNTLYGFALKKSDAASDMILKLSNLLDYILYQVDKPSVLLSNEIKHIENYISLEKMRFQDSLHVNFIKDLHKDNIEIAPMLLLPFIENSFKHGTQINNVLKVDAFLKTSDNLLEFTVSNTSKNSLASKRGIGLNNIKKRLEMLFNNDYTLNITKEDTSFNVALKIPLKNV